MRRVLTPIAKFWICKRGSVFAQEAMECLGGNGYVEERGEGAMARVYREMPLNSIWEGAGNIMALDLLRALRTGPVADALMHELAARARRQRRARSPGRRPAGARRRCHRRSRRAPAGARRGAGGAGGAAEAARARRGVRHLLRIAARRPDRRRRRVRTARRRVHRSMRCWRVRCRTDRPIHTCDGIHAMSDTHLGRGDTAVITGAGSGFGLELARLCAQRGMNIVAADVQADALARAEKELQALGAQVLPVQTRRVAGDRGRGHGPGDGRALRRAAPGVQQRRRRRRRPDLGAHAARLGVGDRRQRDGRGARRARVHAVDARGGREGQPATKGTSSTPHRWPAWSTRPTWACTTSASTRWWR